MDWVKVISYLRSTGQAAFDECRAAAAGYDPYNPERAKDCTQRANLCYLLAAALEAGLK